MHGVVARIETGTSFLAIDVLDRTLEPGVPDPELSATDRASHGTVAPRAIMQHRLPGVRCSFRISSITCGSRITTGARFARPTMAASRAIGKSLAGGIATSS